MDWLSVIWLWGDDFRFGCDRSGSFQSLEESGLDHNYTVAHTRTVVIDGDRVSSTRIRQLLGHGQFDKARRLLGRSFTISGRVLHGQKLGRQLGFPTANLRIGRRHSPVQGVYAVKVHGLEAVYNGVANIGTRPTVFGVSERLEVHILDFDGRLYGRRIQVEFVEKIRDEQRFEQLDGLKQAIADDIARARAILAGSAPAATNVK